MITEIKNNKIQEQRRRLTLIFRSYSMLPTAVKIMKMIEEDSEVNQFFSVKISDFYIDIDSLMKVKSKIDEAKHPLLHKFVLK